VVIQLSSRSSVDVDIMSLVAEIAKELPSSSHAKELEQVVMVSGAAMHEPRAQLCAMTRCLPFALPLKSSMCLVCIVDCDVFAQEMSIALQSELRVQAAQLADMQEKKTAEQAEAAANLKALTDKAEMLESQLKVANADLLRLRGMLSMRGGLSESLISCACVWSCL
jgi:hypothetical protein